MLPAVGAGMLMSGRVDRRVPHNGNGTASVQASIVSSPERREADGDHTRHN